MVVRDRYLECNDTEDAGQLGAWQPMGPNPRLDRDGGTSHRVFLG